MTTISTNGLTQYPICTFICTQLQLFLSSTNIMSQWYNGEIHLFSEPFKGELLNNLASSGFESAKNASGQRPLTPKCIVNVPVYFEIESAIIDKVEKINRLPIAQADVIQDPYVVWAIAIHSKSSVGLLTLFYSSNCHHLSVAAQRPFMSYSLDFIWINRDCRLSGIFSPFSTLPLNARNILLLGTASHNEDHHVVPESL